MRTYKLSILLFLFILSGCESTDLLTAQDGQGVYFGTIESVDAVYDGDTIRDVSVRIYAFDTPKGSRQMLWTGIEQRRDGIYVVTDIRIAGIDTPESRPLRAGRTEASRMREKVRATEATVFLKQLITKHSQDGALGFMIQNIEPDKYAGRTVADVLFVDGDSVISAADALLEAGHAVEYDGGTKTHDWGSE